MKGLTVVIKTFLRDAFLYNCIDTLQATYPQAKVIVVDDGHHTDDKRAWMKARGVRYYELPYDTGLSGGRNYGLDKVRTKYVSFIDDDFAFTQETNYEALRTLLEIADIAAGRSYMNDDYAEFTGLFKINETEVERGLSISPPTTTKSHKGIEYTETHLALNCFIAETKTVRSLDGWDDRMKIQSEHTDFFLRAWEQGLKVVMSPGSVFTHRPENVKDTGPTDYAVMRGRGDSRLIFANKWDFDYVTMNGAKRELPVG